MFIACLIQPYYHTANCRRCWRCRWLGGNNWTHLLSETNRACCVPPFLKAAPKYTFIRKTWGSPRVNMQATSHFKHLHMQKNKNHFCV